MVEALEREREEESAYAGKTIQIICLSEICE